MTSAARLSAPFRRPNPWLVATLLLLGAVWLWLAACRFTGTAWNDIRLVPAFMLAHGEPVYPAPGTGVISTWMYGPLPLVLLWPATQMQTIGGALLVAAGINLLIAVLTLAIACAAWPIPAAHQSDRLLAFAAGLLLWPESSLRYLQADNAAVLAGTLSLVLLARFPVGAAPGWAMWTSALAGAAALACKQVSVGPLLAAMLWLALGAGARAAALHLVRVAAVGAALIITALALAEPVGLWLALVAVPGGLPWAGDLGARLHELAPGLAVAGALPLLVLLADRKRWLAEGSPGQLATLAWIASLPLGLLAAFKTGGSINSFHGYQLLLPPLLLAFATRAEARLGLAGATLVLFAFSAWPVRHGPWRPTLEPAREAVALARAEPGRLWFPWHPLASWYAERRFYHAEDGMYARFMAKRPLPYPHVRSRLPENFSGMALPVGFSDWGIAQSLVPTGAEPVRTGRWQVWRWNLPTERKTRGIP